MTSWLRPHSKGSLLSIYVQPGASKTMISGEHDGRLKIKLKAMAKDGKANACLIDFLAKCLQISKSEVHLVQGEMSRHKVVLVELLPASVSSTLAGI